VGDEVKGIVSDMVLWRVTWNKCCYMNMWMLLQVTST